MADNKNATNNSEPSVTNAELIEAIKAAVAEQTKEITERLDKLIDTVELKGVKVK